jgi:cytoskeletal protein RodZ
LPGGVFNRGFVRTIARYLGLEEDGLLAEYSLATGEKTAPAPVAAEILKQPPAAQTSTPWSAIVVVLILIGLGAGAWYGWNWYETRRTEWLSAESALPARPSAPPVPAGSEPSTPEAANLPGHPQATANSGQGLQLKIDAIKDASLIVTADGIDAFTGTMVMGQSRTVTAKDTLTIEAQDAASVHLELNGQPLAPMGPAGQPGRLTLGHLGAPDAVGGHD